MTTTEEHQAPPDQAPFYVQLLAAGVSVFLWEHLLDSRTLALWRQGIMYGGELLFGMVTADLIWYGIRRLRSRPVSTDRTRLVVYGLGLAAWLIGILVRKSSGESHLGALLGSVGLIVAVAAASVLRKMGVGKRRSHT